jgi:hypothetical protein
MKADEVKAVNGVLDACASDQDTDDWVADVAGATVAWEAAGSPVVPDVRGCTTCASHVPCHQPGERDCKDDRVYLDYNPRCAAPDWPFWKPASVPVDVPSAEAIDEFFAWRYGHEEIINMKHIEAVEAFLRAVKP